MFTGHYAASLAARAGGSRAPLWVYVGASQLLDFGWAGLVLEGVEKLRFDDTLPGSPLDLYFMPYTHSLVAAVCWSLAAMLIARRFWPGWEALLIGLTVFSHWLLDALVHRPDLLVTWPFTSDDSKLGLGLWNLPVPEMAVEMGLLGLAAALLTAQRVRERRSAWPILLFLAALVGLQVYALLAPPATDAAGFATTALGAYAAMVVLAVFVDTGKRGRGSR